MIAERRGIDSDRSHLRAVAPRHVAQILLLTERYVDSTGLSCWITGFEADRLNYDWRIVQA
jgi:hypothetical protein